MARLLVLMGSGETTPTMTSTHREVLAHAGGPAVLLDSPYGFQENAEKISARAVQYFERSCETRLEVARWHDQASPLERETALTLARGASLLFSGPGSPSYALRQWHKTEMAAILADKLARPGALVFASAAACTLGSRAVPVYEIYRCGAEPHWLPGLDLLAPLGFPAVVVPHWNIQVGEDHDTRYCMLGERRLQVMEAELPEDQFLLGLDEHTALVLDLDTLTGQVTGKGTVVVRQRGVTTTFPAGRPFRLGELCDGPAPPVVAAEPPRAQPLVQEVDRLEQAIRAALDQRDSQQAVALALELESLLAEWSHDTDVASLKRARAALRSTLVQLGQAARTASELLEPVVEAMLTLRRQARSRQEWREADAIRAELARAGIEVHDTPEGTRWELAG
ncbi:hypothetical protein DYH09_08410 [bacterium CPR1]|nr:hypothetical protein [bacterium CPR1]